MIYKPFTIIVVPFPFTDSPETKKRPALVMSSEHFQRETSHISLLMITTAKHSHWYGDHQILDLDLSGLSSPSIVRQKLFTIDNRLVKKQIGMLSEKDQQKVSIFFKEHIKIKTHATNG